MTDSLRAFGRLGSDLFRDLLAPDCCVICHRWASLLCAGCRPLLPRDGFHKGAVTCAGLYQGKYKELIAELKRRRLCRLADLVVERWLALEPAWEDVELVVPIPPSGGGIHWADEASILLARRLAVSLRVPFGRVLKRRRGARQQKRLSAEMRRANASRLFSIRRRPPARVLLVDDVWTTGSSLHAAASLIEKAGCRELRAAVAAFQPLQGPAGKKRESSTFFAPVTVGSTRATEQGR